MYLAENLKSLRKGKNLTQEEAAEIIGVSPQSVSKWERGDTCPDITLLPTLANLYKVSVDELIGMDRINDDKARKAVFNTGYEHLRQKDFSAAAAVLSDALKIFPNDGDISSQLAMVLALDDDPAKLSQAIALCEKVLSGNPSEKIRHTTRAALSFMYLKADEKEKAAWIAENLPHMRESREYVLSEFGKNPGTEEINDYLLHIITGDKFDAAILVEFNETMVPMCFDFGLLDRIKELRKELEATKALPPVRVRDNIHLPPNHVRIQYHSECVFDRAFTDLNDAVNEIISTLRRV